MFGILKARLQLTQSTLSKNRPPYLGTMMAANQPFTVMTKDSDYLTPAQIRSHTIILDIQVPKNLRQLFLARTKTIYVQLDLEGQTEEKLLFGICETWKNGFKTLIQIKDQEFSFLSLKLTVTFSIQLEREMEISGFMSLLMEISILVVSINLLSRKRVLICCQGGFMILQRMKLEGC